MAPPIGPSLPPSNQWFDGEASVIDPDVHGVLPAALSGRLLGIGIGYGSDSSDSTSGSVGGGDGVVHSVHLHAGRGISYRSRWIRTDRVAQRLGVEVSSGPPRSRLDVVASAIVAFGDSILAFGVDSLAYELTTDLDTLRRVDLAGQFRGLSPYPKHDRTTGELHLIAGAADGSQAHVVLPPGALTRRSRPIDGAPSRVQQLALTRDRVVFAGDGFVGVTSRDGEGPVTWMATDVRAPDLLHGRESGEIVEVLVGSPSLERWTLDAASAIASRDVLDPTPRQFICIGDHVVDAAPRFLWTVGDGAVDKHDLATHSHVRHGCGPSQPGDLVFVADPSRPSDADAGWLVGFAHTDSPDAAEVVVFDAADFTGSPIAAVRIPRPIPLGLHSTWIPSTHR
jgi:8'-apo-carotenoid 13,14-cleaving dioxygenase